MDTLQKLIGELLSDPLLVINGGENFNGYNLSLEDLTDEEVSTWMEELRPIIIKKMMECIPGGILGRKRIVKCEVPNNGEWVQEASARQCTNNSCSAYFCQKHVLNRCPKCGDFLI